MKKKSNLYYSLFLAALAATPSIWAAGMTASPEMPVSAPIPDSETARRLKALKAAIAKLEDRALALQEKVGQWTTEAAAISARLADIERYLQFHPEAAPELKQAYENAKNQYQKLFDLLNSADVTTPILSVLRRTPLGIPTLAVLEDYVVRIDALLNGTPPRPSEASTLIDEANHVLELANNGLANGEATVSVVPGMIAIINGILTNFQQVPEGYAENPPPMINEDDLPSPMA